MKRAQQLNTQRRIGDLVQIPGDYQCKALNQGHPVQRAWHRQRIMADNIFHPFFSHNGRSKEGGKTKQSAFLFHTDYPLCACQDKQPDYARQNQNSKPEDKCAG